MKFPKLFTSSKSKSRQRKYRMGREGVNSQSQYEKLEPRQLLASLVWGSGPTLPSARGDAAAVVQGDSAVVLGGTSAGNEREVFALSANASSWEFWPENDAARPDAGVTHVGSGDILVFGGLQGGDEATDEVLIYDYIFGDSQDAAKMSVPRADMGFAADDVGRAYALGGLDADGGVLATGERYDAVSDSWTSIAELPYARSSAAAVNDGQGNILLIGGLDAQGMVVDSVFRYDVVSDVWSEIGNLPIGVEDSAAVYSENGNIYVLGGKSASGIVDTVQVYDVALNVWSIDTALPNPVHSEAAVIDSLGQILIVGGYDASNQLLNTVVHSQQLNVDETAPVITTNANKLASIDTFYSYDVNATGNPNPTFSLQVAPEGMVIDESTGLIEWQPVESQIGQQTVTVIASNRVGSVEQTYVIEVRGDTTNPVGPFNLTVSSITSTTAQLSWDAATDNFGVESYTIYQGRKCGWRNRNWCYTIVVQSGVTETNYTVTDVAPLSTHRYKVVAVDAAGNKSTGSNHVSVYTLGEPTYFNYSGTTQVSATHSMTGRVYARANPLPVFSIQSAPQGMVLNPATGDIEWTPTVDQLGIHTVVFRASNSEGFVDTTATIEVRSDVPAPFFVFNLHTSQAQRAVAGEELEILIFELSNSPPTYELVSAPADMVIDPNTGTMLWTPTPADAGATSIVLRATNDAGVTEATANFYTHFTGDVSDVQITDLNQLHPIASWNAPLGAGSDQIDHYDVLAYARYRYGRSWRTEQINFTVAPNTPLEITGLTSRRRYKLFVTPVDQDGNTGIRSAGTSFVSVPAVPRIRWTARNAVTGAEVIAQQPMQIQLTDLDLVDPSSLELVSGPAGMVFDPVNMIATWTPTSADIGPGSAIFRATNSITSIDIPARYMVYFSGAVRNLSAVRNLNTNSAFVSWQHPLDNVAPIHQYRVTLHWTWSGRPRSRTIVLAGSATSVTLPLVPTGSPISFKSVTVTPISLEGYWGVSDNDLL